MQNKSQRLLQEIKDMKDIISICEYKLKTFINEYEHVYIKNIHKKKEEKNNVK